MKFFIDRDVLLTGLQHLLGAAEKRLNLPIYGNVLLVLENDLLTLVTTNGEIEISETLVVDECVEAGTTTVSAQKLNEIVRVLPNNVRIEFELENKRLHLFNERSQYTLQTLPASEFPKSPKNIPSQVQLNLPQADLKQLLENVYFSIAQLDVRYYLNGMCLVFSQDKITSVASDGHRLSLSTVNVPGFDGNMQIILPRKSVIELLKLLDSSGNNVEVFVGPTQVKFIIGQLEFITKLIDAKFPLFHSLLPKGEYKEITLPADALKQTLQRVAIIATDKNRGVQFLLSPGKLVVICHNQQQEEANEALDVVYNGKELDIAYNITYFIDLLNHNLDQTIHLHFYEENNAIIARYAGNEETLHMIMPMRI